MSLPSKKVIAEELDSLNVKILTSLRHVLYGNWYEKSSSTNKEALLDDLSSFLSDKEKVLAGFKQLPEIFQQVVYHLTWQEHAKLLELEELFDVKLLKDSHNKYFSLYNVKLAFPLIRLYEESYHYRSYDRQEMMAQITVYLHDIISICFRAVLPKPEDGHIQSSDEPPASQYSWLADNHCLTDIQVAQSLVESGQLELTSTGSYTAASLKKLRQSTDASPFFPSSYHYEDILLNLANELSAQNGSAATLKKAFPALLDIDEMFLLPYIKSKYSTRGLNLGIKAFLELLKSLPVKQWVDIDYLSRAVKYQDIRPQKMRFYDFSYTLRRNYSSSQRDMKSLYAEKRSIVKKNSWNDFYQPLIKARFFMLAAMGLFDLAYNDPSGPPHKRCITIDGMIQESNSASDYSGLRAVRLTELGAYLLSKSKSFAVTSTREQAQVDLQTHLLILTLSKSDAVLESLLQKWTEPNGTRCYRMTYISFLFGCRSRKDLEDKIGVFREKVCKNPPEIWEQFFEQLLQRAFPLTPLSSPKLFQVNANQPELCQLLSSHPELKKLIMKVEGGRFAIDASHYPAMVKILEEEGYLI